MEREVSMGVWLGRENEKNVVRPGYFFPRTYQNVFSPKLGENWGESYIL